MADNAARFKELSDKAKTGPLTPAETTEMKSLLSQAPEAQPGGTLRAAPLLTGDAAKAKVQADAKAAIAAKPAIEALGEARHPTAVSQLAAGDMSPLPVNPDKAAGAQGLPTVAPGNAEGFEAHGLAPAPVAVTEPEPVVEPKSSFIAALDKVAPPVVETPPAPTSAADDLLNDPVPPIEAPPEEPPVVEPTPESAPEPVQPVDVGGATPTAFVEDPNKPQEELPPAASEKLVEAAKKPASFLDTVGKLAKDFAVPVLQILQAYAYGRSGNLSAPTSLKAEAAARIADASKKLEAEYMDRLETARVKLQHGNAKELQAGAQTFQGQESAADRKANAALAAAGQTFTAGENTKGRNFTAGENTAGRTFQASQAQKAQVMQTALANAQLAWEQKHGAATLKNAVDIANINREAEATYRKAMLEMQYGPGGVKAQAADSKIQSQFGM
jgi:hypothetical protein